MRLDRNLRQSRVEKKVLESKGVTWVARPIRTCRTILDPPQRV